ncbi:hypothetical protein [Roseibium sp.]|uniref:hypothetical protein n=1 Tax=Roseibium sp. TaxID=1936156 RepID=UPI003A985B3C
MRAIIGLLLFVFVVSGCVSRSGVAEFVTYKTVFDESTAVSTALIDQLSASERRIGQYQRLRGSKGAGKVFNVSDAAYYSREADPPLAAHYRKALDVIGRYNVIMLGYATGRGFDELEAEIFALSAEASKTVDLVTGSTQIAAQFAPYLGMLREFADLGLAARSRQVFRDKAVAYHADIVGLIETMRDGAPEIFEVLTFWIEKDIVDGTVAGRGVGELRDKHLQVRVLVSDWVILMNRNIDALNAVVFAIENPSLGSDLSGATTSLIELQTTVKAVRTHLAEVNS